MNLNVGCGGGRYLFQDLHCEVNCDIERPQLKIRNFVLSDGQYLPFNKNIFEETYCYHVIEHVANPIMLLKELIRVTKNKVVIKCPHRFSVNAKKDPLHKNFFNVTWFRKALKNFKHEITVDYTEILNLTFLLIRRPNEITVEIFKNCF